MNNTDRNSKRINRIRKKINQGRIINRDILKVYIFFVVIFAALILFACYFISFQASSVINNSFNRRADALNKTVLRGSILADGGEVLASSYLDAEGNEIRVYPYANTYAHVVGFNSNGGMGLESAYNYYLLTSHAGLFEKIANEFNHQKNTGDSIKTTLKAGLQSYIYDLLGESNGAVLCMNPDTGEIYAMVSKPDFNPNYISQIWDQIVQEEENGSTDAANNSVLLNRATQGLFTPGSTFKIFTLYEYFLENPKAYQQFSYQCEGSIEVGDTTISCYNGAHHGHEDLTSAFANSCNCAFGTIGASLNLDHFRETTSKLLFDTDLPVDIASAKSKFVLSSSDTDFDIVATAIGQGDTQMTPLHLAMVVSAIANEGVCMKPYLVTSILNPSGEVTGQFPSEPFRRLFTAEEAQMMKSYLRAVVTDGTGSAVYPGNFQAYGKTGTAEKESSVIGDYDHSWFVGWAENNEQKLAVCVILENMNASGMTGVYVSKLIFDYYFGW